MNKNLLLLTIFFGLLLFNETTAQDSCEGTMNSFDMGTTAAGCTRIGDGTAGQIRICLTENNLGGAKCSGNDEGVLIYDGGGTLRVYWTAATPVGTCYTVPTTDGYACLRTICRQAGNDATVTWTTVDGSGNNVCVPDCDVDGDCPAGYECQSGSCVCVVDCDDPIGGGNPNYIGQAQEIDECGTAFNVSNAGANADYSETQGPCGPVGSDLDCNSSTSHGGLTDGRDVPWSIENSIFYVFCPEEPADWTITIDAPPCSNTGGYQYAAFQGTPDNLHTMFFASQCQQTQGQSCVMSMNGENSETFSVNNPDAGCVYLVIDGHAGATCDFSVSLSTTLDCNLVPLPVTLISFYGIKTKDHNKLFWSTSTEIDNNYFTIHHSIDGENWRDLAKINGAGNSSTKIEYSYEHSSFSNAINYYILSQTDFDGTTVSFNTVSVDNRGSAKVIKTVNLMGQEVDKNFKGVVIDYYDNGSVKKRFQ